ncbi:hypothetical protein PC111_g10773 [Phytophthora cactorum]|nr:hypothetical protein PC111_g10773 [Phytophthora cactorum]KAG3182981.1 hypothetical protein C6341_g5678 [Phytophthora cactorum]
MRREDGDEIPTALAKFAFSLANVPVVYFIGSTCKLPFDAFEDLVRNINLGDQQLRVLVIIQVQEQGSTARSPYRFEFVYLVDTDPPYAQLFPRAAATIHWGELRRITWWQASRRLRITSVTDLYRQPVPAT